jgi:alpha 1,2-mannosyltransferase
MIDSRVTQFFALKSRLRVLIILTAAIFVLTTVSVFYSGYLPDGAFRQRFSSISLPWQQSTSTQQCGAMLQSDELESMYKSSADAVGLGAGGGLIGGAKKGLDGNIYPPEYVPQLTNKAPRAKAGFVVLARNSELEAMRRSMKDVEFRFNRKYGYPWIFLNSKWIPEDRVKGYSSPAPFPSTR